MNFSPGDRVKHHEFGEGIVVSLSSDGYARVFFQTGERQIPVHFLSFTLSRNELIVKNAKGGKERALKAWLSWKSHTLPLLDSASSLTSAKIDLLPHQVVLTHRVATASPRRFLIADEVGLGKTIETALILRELASRGELERALMVVPAGLVNNWHQELNEVFNLNFEVFGHEGDVTDRRSNAFAKHNRLIASIDTLKRPARIKRLLEAPMWDLVVFDEAHHLTAYRSGNKTRKTENYKLAEALRDHARDLLLLSATPHQGDHYRFWKIVQLLDPTLFSSPDEMIELRHRLNPIVFRRTKADACRSDGSTLFARRLVHTESFIMSDEERRFYLALNEYLREGFALAKQQGGQGRALGFVMTIFQKIAASSFAAVNRTLRRRLIALTVQEGLAHDLSLDIESRDTVFNEAREQIRHEFSFGNDRLSNIEIDRILNELKRRLLKKLNEEELALASNEFTNELETQAAEDAAASSVTFALPEERNLIKNLFSLFPQNTETKVENLLRALGVLWNQNPKERVVIFATYLGTVEMLEDKIEQTYPGQGVVVLKGGDHGSKTAAEKRFKQPSGPRILIATAAGREGINLQHARVLFNFDLPWNPMDVEQRIGRIHRYGQQDTAQVYNLVLSDTIEGRIFLLLNDKLNDIAKALGKVDERGDVAEDLRSQVLGQLSEKVNYQKLYSHALDDPELKRTRVELEAAMKNATEARMVVNDLFQDLDRFSLDEYSPLANTEKGMQEIVRFVEIAAGFDGYKFQKESKDRYILLNSSNIDRKNFTTDRDKANEDEYLELLGIDHPIVAKYLSQYRKVTPDEVGVRVLPADSSKGILTSWEIEVSNDKGQLNYSILNIAIDEDGKRIPKWERSADEIFQWEPNHKEIDNFNRLETIEQVMERELIHRNLIKGHQPYSAKLIGWVEISS